MITAEKILKEAIMLKPIEQAQLIDGLLSVLDKPDSVLDKMWGDEAEQRLAAYKKGILKTVSVEEVISKYK